MAVEVSAAVEMASVAEATAWAAVDSAWEAAATASAAAEMALVAEATAWAAVDSTWEAAATASPKNNKHPLLHFPACLIW